MNYRELNRRAEFYGIRDCSVDGFNAQREFSEPLVKWVKLTPRNAVRVIEDVNALGNGATVTHTALVRKFSHDKYTMALICGDLFQVFNAVEYEKDRNFMVMGLIYKSKYTVQELSQPVFIGDAMQ